MKFQTIALSLIASITRTHVAPFMFVNAATEHAGAEDQHEDMIIAARHLRHHRIMQENKEVSDGLSEAFMKRVVKAAAASYLSRAGDNLKHEGTELSAEGIKDTLNEFSSNAKIIQKSEPGAHKGLDDTILIEDGGQCIVAFQSTTMSINDILQNFDLNKKKLCNAKSECCEFRQGYVDGWKTEYEAELVEQIKDCTTRCNTDDVCLIITGHSQGGAIATVASLELSALTPNYEVITFAAPHALTWNPSKCSPHMDFKRHYRFGKALYKKDGGFLFDWISFLSHPFNSYAVGEFLILSSEDTRNVAYEGLNTQKKFGPRDTAGVLGDAHTLYVENYCNPEWYGTGYFQLVRKMRDENVGKFPVPVNGFENGMHCGTDTKADRLCASKLCIDGETAVDPVCSDEKLNNGENCSNDDDCISGRCDGKSWGNLLDYVCTSKLAKGQSCNEDTDCLSGECPWTYRCE